MSKYIIKQATLINEGREFIADVLIDNDRIVKIDSNIQVANANEIIAENCFLLPGIIDDQVHFREPGLTHKGNIYSESRAAVAGGVTSFMEMPNTNPQAVTQELLEDKYSIAQAKSLANYSFFMGTTNDNYDEVMRTPLNTVCGIKIFMGSSTGNMLVDNPNVLENIFANTPHLIATHCEDENTIKHNLEFFKAKYGDELTAIHHPQIRSAEACYLSSSMAAELACKHNTRLHILHISTAKETNLFTQEPLNKKRITAEACIHHLWFCDEDYAEKGNFIKWNPAIKSVADRTAIWEALLDGRIDVIATDHAPHTIEEKQSNYLKAPSGGPLVQHSLQAMMQFYKQQKISLPQIVTKMCHNPAILFNIEKRGFIREGYFADLVIVKKQLQQVKKNNILYHCNWSPFEEIVFDYTVSHTFVNGHLAWNEGRINDEKLGKRLSFER